MLPYLVAGASLLGGVYSVGKAVDSYRYWSDYYKNTGFKPRYPFRTGVYDYIGDFGRTFGYGARFYRGWY